MKVCVPSGEAGNCRQFALLLRQAAQQLGAQFQFNATVSRIGHTPASVQLKGQAQAQRFDAVVLCAGVASSALLQPLGLQAGDQVVVYPPAALTDGARVQLRTP